MRKKHTFIASLVLALVVVSALAYRGAPQRSTTGTVVQFEAGEWIAVANENTDPSGLRIALRKGTTYQGSSNAIQTGVSVIVFWKSVGERYFVADQVRLLPLTTHH